MGEEPTSDRRQLSETQFNNLERFITLGKVALIAVSSYFALDALGDFVNGEFASGTNTAAKTAFQSGLISFAGVCIKELARPTSGVILK